MLIVPGGGILGAVFKTSRNAKDEHGRLNRRSLLRLDLNLPTTHYGVYPVDLLQLFTMAEFKLSASLSGHDHDVSAPL